MASDNNANSPSSSRTQHRQLVSAMIKQGFVSEPLLSPPPTFRPLSDQNQNQNPTLFEMMSLEQAPEPRPSPEDHRKLQETVSAVLAGAPFRNSNRWGAGDVRLTVSSSSSTEADTAAFRVSMDVHRVVLAERSRFFAEKLRRSGTHSVEILDCDDVAVYVEAVVLMYCDELKPKLLGMAVSKILTLLKISSAVMFEDGVSACLDYLESVPWSEQEEYSVVSHLNQLRLHTSKANFVLQRLIPDQSSSSRADEIFLKLSLGLLQAKDEKARKEMKALITRLLREDHHEDSNTFHNKLDISKDTLYQLCHRCLSSLILCLSGATENTQHQDRGALMAEIAREADNMQWMVGILVDRKTGDEFVQMWADQKELEALHSKIPIMYRHEISKITAQICVYIGKGQVLVPKETRFALLETWLEALYEDFGWMRNGRVFDRKVVEDGLCRTILTLSLSQQQLILVKWFDRFVNGGEDCPNIQRAFEVWWRRAFVRRHVVESNMQITVCDVQQ